MAAMAAVFTSLKAATDIAKFLRESDVSIERAELRLKLADLVGSLADAKMQLAELQEDLGNKDRRISELETAFETKHTLVRDNDAYYVVDAAGNAAGKPYCVHCWENDQKQRQLVHDLSGHTRVCTTCRTQYTNLRSGEKR